MSMFAALGISGSGLLVNRKWLDAVSDNIAGSSTVSRTDQEAFRARYVVAQAAQYGEPAGVRVAGALLGDADGRVVSMPDHPLADEDGMVRVPDVDLGDQMVQLMMAQRAYQANLSVLERAREAYQQALQLGR
jgi:flagellar basal-body rod protein FlgC